MSDHPRMPQSPKDEDEAYEIGKRDGYESAVHRRASITTAGRAALDQEGK